MLTPICKLGSSTGRHFYSKSQSLVSSSGYNVNEGLDSMYTRAHFPEHSFVSLHSGYHTWQKHFWLQFFMWNPTQRIRCRNLGIHRHTIALRHNTGIWLYINGIDNHFTRAVLQKNVVSIGYTYEGSPKSLDIIQLDYSLRYPRFGTEIASYRMIHRCFGRQWCY